jgi:hypothetical protein
MSYRAELLPTIEGPDPVRREDDAGRDGWQNQATENGERLSMDAENAQAEGKEDEMEVRHHV